MGNIKERIFTFKADTDLANRLFRERVLHEAANPVAGHAKP